MGKVLIKDLRTEKDAAQEGESAAAAIARHQKDKAEKQEAALLLDRTAKLEEKLSQVLEQLGSVTSETSTAVNEL